MPGTELLLRQDGAVGHRFCAADFDLERWRRSGAQALAGGRGGSLLIGIEGRRYVLRRYLRGGLLARLGLAHDRYAWTGLDRTRPLREKRVVDYALARQLPVPAVRAVAVEHSGLFYRAAIISDFAANQGTLADAAMRGPPGGACWRSVGETIARFHACRVLHADLNANNILLTRADTVTLIDFDKARVMPGRGRWCDRNLQRLQRSLLKLQSARRAAQQPFHFSEDDWSALLGGYRQAAVGADGVSGAR